MGFPLEMFPVLFAIPRTAGWLAHWQEMLDQDSKISRPRQLYIGSEERDYAPMQQPLNHRAVRVRMRTSPSWARETHRRPCRSNRKPRARPRPWAATGESVS